MKNNYNYLFIIKIILITYLWFPAADLHPWESVFRLCHILQCKITYEGANRPCKSCLDSCIIGHFVLVTHWLQKEYTDRFADIDNRWVWRKKEVGRVFNHRILTTRNATLKGRNRFFAAYSFRINSFFDTYFSHFLSFFDCVFRIKS